jgi:hypothetical protein
MRSDDLGTSRSIPNNAKHFRTILFSEPSRGERPALEVARPALSKTQAKWPRSYVLRLNPNRQRFSASTRASRPVRLPGGATRAQQRPGARSCDNWSRGTGAGGLERESPMSRACPGSPPSTSERARCRGGRVFHELVSRWGPKLNTNQASVEAGERTEAIENQALSAVSNLACHLVFLTCRARAAAWRSANSSSRGTPLVLAQDNLAAHRHRFAGGLAAKFKPTTGTPDADARPARTDGPL